MIPLHPGRAFQSRYVGVVLAALLGTLAAIAAFLVVLSWEYRVAEIDFQSKAKSFLQIINADLGDARTLLYTIGAYMDSNERPVSRTEFERFSKVLHERVIGLRDTGWAPRVTQAARGAFERAARLAGVAPHFEISERDAHGNILRAHERSHYFPLLYVETRGIKVHVLGVDLISEAVRAKALTRSITTGQPAATPPMRLYTVNAKDGGVMVFMPVAHRSNRVAGTGGGAQGVVLGIFDIAGMIENIVAKKTRGSGLDLYLYNPAGTPERRLIYWHSPSGKAAPVPTERSFNAEANWHGSIWMVDQRWGAIVTPTDPLRFFKWNFDAVVTLVAGLTMTAMIVAYLLISLRRTIHLESLTASLRDTTEGLHRNTEQIAHMARHDALTGLPNRLLFRERMDEAVAHCRRGSPFAILYLDLDEFKSVNDTLGHDVGDQLLFAVAERIRCCLREIDTVARLGGDEFAIILWETASPETIGMVADRLIREVGTAYVIGEQMVLIGVSIGIALGANDSATTESLLKEADLALYEAKEAGRGTFRFFESRLSTRIEVRRTLEHDLRRGLGCNEFEVYYQPIINIARNRVAGFEALVRWNHPDRGLVPPDEFIPLAEQRGLIMPLGFWVLRTACEQAARWPVPVKVAVNISPVQLRAAGLLTDILECLAMSGLPPERLEIEITEAAVLQEHSTTREFLDDLRALGVAVAFDDFGTGFSSLSSILRFPFDNIKIDRSFVHDVQTSRSAAAVVHAIVGMGVDLDLETTGEGVETLEQLACLRSLGCTQAQGYLFSPPRPNSDVPLLLAALGNEGGATAGALRYGIRV